MPPYNFFLKREDRIVPTTPSSVRIVSTRIRKFIFCVVCLGRVISVTSALKTCEPSWASTPCWLERQHSAMPAINRGAASRRPRENSEEADALAKVSGAGTLRAARIVSNDHSYLACTGILTSLHISRCETGSPIHRGMGHPLQTCCHRVSLASCEIQSPPDPPASHAIPLVSTMKRIARTSCFDFYMCLRVAGCALLWCMVVRAHALICANTYARLQRRACGLCRIS